MPDTRQSGLSLSGLFLFEESKDKDDKDGLRDVQALRRFPRGGALYYAAHIHNAARDAAGAADVVAQSQIRRGGALQGASPVEPVPIGAKDEAATPLRGRIALEGLQAGAYELRLLVVDRKAGAQAERRIDFTIEDATASARRPAP